MTIVYRSLCGVCRAYIEAESWIDFEIKPGYAVFDDASGKHYELDIRDIISILAK